jgi:chromosome segregation ATPase
MDNNERFGQLEGMMPDMLRRMDRMDQRLESVDQRLESMDQRLESVDQRLESVDQRLERMEQVQLRMLGVMQQMSDNVLGVLNRMPQLDDHEARLRRLESIVLPKAG